MKKDKRITFFSYVISVAIHILLFLILLLIPVGEFAKPGVKAKDYYPVDIVIKVKEKVISSDIIEIKEVKSSEKQEKKSFEKQEKKEKEIEIKEIKESKVIEKVKKEEDKLKEKKEEEKKITQLPTQKDVGQDTGKEGKEGKGQDIVPRVGVISLPFARYTKTAENLEVEGKVEVTFRSDENGRFEKLDVISATVINTAGDEARAEAEIKQITISTIKKGQYGPMSAITIVCLFEKIGENFRVSCNEKK